MLDGIVDKIKTLPPLPESFHKINEICASPDGTIEKLAKVIEKDPMLVANILKAANSPLYGLKEIKSVLQAISLFGMTMTRALATDISIKKLLKVDIEPYGVLPEDFVEISNIQGALASKWYRKVNPKKVDTLFLCALMQETGKILIADEIVKNDETTQFKSEIELAYNISQVERSYVGTTTAMVTSAIFEHWGFDKIMVNSIKYSDNPSSAEDATIKEYATALNIIRTAVPINAPLSERSVTIALNLISESNYDDAVFAEAIEKIIDSY